VGSVHSFWYLMDFPHECPGTAPHIGDFQVSTAVVKLNAIISEEARLNVRGSTAKTHDRGNCDSVEAYETALVLSIFMSSRTSA